MSYEWPKVPLGDILRLDEDRVAVVPGQEYPQIGVRGFGRGLFERGSVAFDQTTYSHFNRLYEGALVVSQVKGWEGAIAVAPRKFAERFASPEYRTFRLDTTKVDPSYLLRFLLSSHFASSIQSSTRGQGARRERVRPEQLVRQLIPLPPLAEQRRVAAKIERLVGRIDEALGVHDHSTTALRILDDSSAAAAAESVPAAYWRPLGEIVEVGGGGTPSKDNPAFWGGDVPWISPKDMKHRRIQNATDHITQIALDNSAAKLHAPGCVLIVIRGTSYP